MRLRRTRWCGLWSWRPRVRVPSLTLSSLRMPIFRRTVDRARGKTGRIQGCQPLGALVEHIGHTQMLSRVIGSKQGAGS